MISNGGIYRIQKKNQQPPQIRDRKRTWTLRREATPLRSAGGSGDQESDGGSGRRGSLGITIIRGASARAGREGVGGGVGGCAAGRVNSACRLPSRRPVSPHPAAAGDRGERARAGFQVEGRAGHRWFARSLLSLPLPLLPAPRRLLFAAVCSLLVHTARAHQISRLVSCLPASLLTRAGDLVGLVQRSWGRVASTSSLRATDFVLFSRKPRRRLLHSFRLGIFDGQK
jgi:hypothetical protein